MNQQNIKKQNIQSQVTVSQEANQKCEGVIGDLKENQKRSQGIKKNILKQKRQKQKNDDIVYARTKQLIQTYRNKQFNAPYNIVGFIYGLYQNQHNAYIQPQSYFGTCIIINEHLALCSAHQISVLQGYKFFIKLPRSNLKEKDKKQIQFLSLDAEININQYYSSKKIPQNDYAFLKIKNVSQQGKKQVQKRTYKLSFSKNDQIYQKDFTFKNGTNLGFIPQIPNQILDRQNIQPFRLLISKGTIYYYNGYILEYDAYTINGMSGGPIIINGAYIIGMHLYGNAHVEKNYGMLFTKAFFDDLQSFALKQKIPLKLQFISIAYYVESYTIFSDKLISWEKEAWQNLRIQEKVIHKNSKEYGLKNQLRQKLSEQILKFLYILMNELKDLQQQSIYIIQAEDKDMIIINNERICFKKVEIKYNLFQKQRFHYENNSMHFLRNLIFQNRLIQQITYDKESTGVATQQKKLDELKRSVKNNRSFQYWDKISHSFKGKSIKDNTQIQPKYMVYMDDYNILDFKIRAENYAKLLKKFNFKASKKAFLKMYITMISEIYQNISLNISSQQSINKILQKLMGDFKFNINEEFPKQFEYYKNTYMKIFYSNKLLCKHHLIQDLSKYEIIFIDWIYKQHLRPIIQKINDFQSQSFKEIRFSFQQFFDNLPQNCNPLVRNQNPQQQINMFTHILKDNETQRFNYKITPLTLHQEKKYGNLLSLLVQIRNDQNQDKLIGTGFFISSKYICTARHNFGLYIEDYYQLQGLLSSHYIYFKGQRFNIKQCHPRKIVAQKQFDIIVVELQKEVEGIQNLQIMSFVDQYQEEEKQRGRNEKHFAILLGFVQQERKVICKKAIGQISISEFIPLDGQPMISGSPIFMWSRDKKPFLVGVYTGITIQNEENKQKKGRYAKFNRIFFQEIEKNFPSISSREFQNSLNDQAIVTYIQEIYGSLDHFLLRVISSILTQNKDGYYLAKPLKISDLILNREDCLDILFQSNVLVHKNNIINKKDILPINLQSFYEFTQYLQKIYNNFKKNNLGAQIKYSYILWQFLEKNFNINKEVHLTLRKYIEFIDNKYKVGDNKQLIAKQKSNDEILRALPSTDSQYYTMYQRHFFLKPQIRLQKLIRRELSQVKTNDEPAIQIEEASLQRRKNNIDKYLSKRQFQLQNMKKQASFEKYSYYSFLFQLFTYGVAKLKEDKSLDTKIMQKFNDHFRIFEQNLKKITGGIRCLRRQILQNFIKQQKQQFRNNFLKIMRWTMVEEMHEYFHCLDHVTGRQMREKLNYNWIQQLVM